MYWTTVSGEISLAYIGQLFQERSVWHVLDDCFRIDHS